MPHILEEVCLTFEFRRDNMFCRFQWSEGVNWIITKLRCRIGYMGCPISRIIAKLRCRMGYMDVL